MPAHDKTAMLASYCNEKSNEEEFNAAGLSHEQKGHHPVFGAMVPDILRQSDVAIQSPGQPMSCMHSNYFCMLRIR